MSYRGVNRVELIPDRERRGRRALVTGGAIRVGRSVCLALGKAGYRVAVHYRTSQSDAAATVRDLKRMGGQPIALKADLGDPEQLESMFDQIDEHFGGLDLLVNGAAIFPRGEPLEVTISEWDEVFAINTRAAFRCADARGLEHRQHHGYGRGRGVAVLRAVRREQGRVDQRDSGAGTGPRTRNQGQRRGARSSTSSRG